MFDIYLSPPHLSGEELAYVASTLQKGWIAPAGENLAIFEQKVAHFTKSPYALALNSGTSAMHLALKALDINKDDIVLCQSFTFVATLNPILYQQAIPVLIDSELLTWNISPIYLEKAINYYIQKGKKPKAIVVVHLYGKPALVSEICAIAAHYQIPIIEDAAEALGAFYKQQHVGTFGNVGFFSFNGNKIITTSAGGMFITPHQHLREIALFWATQAKEKTPHYQHKEVGYNYRMSNVLAALGIAQMEVLPRRIAKRIEIFGLYQQYLQHLPEIIFPSDLPHTIATHWLTCILLPNAFLAEKIRITLAQNHIETRSLWKPLHLQPLAKDFTYFGAQVAQDLFEKGLCLPSGSQLTEAQIQDICQLIEQCLR